MVVRTRLSTLPHRLGDRIKPLALRLTILDPFTNPRMILARILPSRKGIGAPLLGITLPRRPTLCLKLPPLPQLPMLPQPPPLISPCLTLCLPSTPLSKSILPLCYRLNGCLPRSAELRRRTVPLNEIRPLTFCPHLLVIGIKPTRKRGSVLLPRTMVPQTPKPGPCPLNLLNYPLSILPVSLCPLPSEKLLPLLIRTTTLRRIDAPPSVLTRPQQLPTPSLVCPRPVPHPLNVLLNLCPHKLPILLRIRHPPRRE